MEKIEERYHTLISKDGKIFENFRNLCKKGFDKNQQFFNTYPEKFKIIVTPDEKTFKKETGKLYFPWAKGYALKGKKIIIRSRESHEQCYKKYKGTRDISLIITHEINHIFSQQMNLHKGPYWLFEGIAMHVAGQKLKRTRITAKKINRERAKQFLMYRQVRKKQGPEGYIVYNKATEYLINAYGKESLRKLFSTYTPKMRKVDFELNFKKIYSISYKEFCNNVIALF